MLLLVGVVERFPDLLGGVVSVIAGDGEFTFSATSLRQSGSTPLVSWASSSPRGESDTLPGDESASLSSLRLSASDRRTWLSCPTEASPLLAGVGLTSASLKPVDELGLCATGGESVSSEATGERPLFAIALFIRCPCFKCA